MTLDDWSHAIDVAKLVLILAFVAFKVSDYLKQKTSPPPAAKHEE